MPFPKGNRFAILLSNSNGSVNFSAALLITRVNKTWPFVQCHAFVDRGRASSLADSFLLKSSFVCVPRQPLKGVACEKIKRSPSNES